MEQRTAVRADIEHTQDSSLSPHRTSHNPPPVLPCPTEPPACLPVCLSMLEMSEQPAYPALSPIRAGTSR